MDEKVTSQLQDLFEFTTPKSLTKSLHQVFFNYLLEMKETYPDNFETIVSDFYFLILFLQNAEDIIEQQTPR